jgi:hypothetical protein
MINEPKRKSAIKRVEALKDMRNIFLRKNCYEEIQNNLASLFQGRDIFK